VQVNNAKRTMIVMLNVMTIEQLKSNAQIREFKKNVEFSGEKDDRKW
jgi:hypothetical protein